MREQSISHFNFTLWCKKSEVKISALHQTSASHHGRAFFFGVKMKESELLSFALKLLKNKGILHWRVANGPVMHTIGTRVIYKPSPIKGMPDIAGLMPCGRFFAIELKSAKGRLSPEQVNWINKINDSHGVAVVIRTSNELLEFCHAILDDDVIH